MKDMAFFGGICFDCTYDTTYHLTAGLSLSSYFIQAVFLSFFLSLASLSRLVTTLFAPGSLTLRSPVFRSAPV